jgi:hypothetical protein
MARKLHTALERMHARVYGRPSVNLDIAEEVNMQDKTFKKHAPRKDVAVPNYSN